MKVGDIVYLQDIRNDTIKVTKLRKIGRVWCEVEGSWLKFNIGTGEEKYEGYSSYYKIWFSEQTIKDTKEKAQLDQIIRQQIGGYGPTKFTLDQCKRIVAIINEKI